MKSFAALALALLLLPAAARAEIRRFDFEVRRNGTPIGSHVVTVETREGKTQVQVTVDLAVTFGPFTLYRYTHRSIEQWRDGRLVDIEGRTDDDGTKLAFKAWAEGGQVVLEGPDGRMTGPAGTIPSSYWNPKLRDTKAWLETHWGVLDPVTVITKPAVTLKLPGREVRAIPHRIISGKAEVTPFYTEDGEWVGMTFELWGAHFEYVMRPAS